MTYSMSASTLLNNNYDIIVDNTYCTPYSVHCLFMIYVGIFHKNKKPNLNLILLQPFTVDL